MINRICYKVAQENDPLQVFLH